MKFVVEYSIERDMHNYINSVWRMKYAKHGRDDLRKNLLMRCPKEYQKDIQAAKTEEEAKKITKIFLEKNYQKHKNEFQSKISKVQNFLDQGKANIIKVLEEAYRKKFPFNKITVYLTTNGICPFNYEKHWFMLYDYADLEKCIHVATHELNHFMFFYYHFDNLKERGINEYNLKVLREALPILTGDEGGRKLDVIELEQFIKPLKGRPIEEIIELAIQSKAFKNIRSPL